jgi:hypothetical protein
MYSDGTKISVPYLLSETIWLAYDDVMVIINASQTHEAVAK